MDQHPRRTAAALDRYCTEGRNKGRPNTSSRSRRPVRQVPIPPELVTLLRVHLGRFGTGPDGRLFRSVNGSPLQPSTCWQVVPSADLTESAGAEGCVMLLWAQDPAGTNGSNRCPMGSWK